MPDPPLGPIYDAPDLDMELLVFQRGYPPGRATLRTLRSYSANVEAGLTDRLNNEAQTRANADTALGQRIDAEASTRATSDAAEASARQTADTQEAQARAAADTTLGQRITDETIARQNADTVEAQARAAADAQEKADRQAADAAEAKARADADTAEAKARSDADTAEAAARIAGDKALQDQITALRNVVVPLVGSMVLPAGITLLVGKSTRTVAVAGLKRNDNLVVTPNAALPANISMGEAYCLTDGTLTVVLLNTALLGLNITTAQTIPLGIVALRPQT